ncbi:MAG: hypothetical protein AAGA28_07715 [Pseudomonadota bacterium]
MKHAHYSQSADTQSILKLWGLWAVLTGAVGVALVFLGMLGPSLVPGPSAASQIGEIAGEIKRSAWLSFLGMKPDPVAPETGVDPWVVMAFIAPFLGLVAIVLSVISGVMHENRRLVAAGATLGGVAVLFQFFWWLALLICGVVLLVSVLSNIGDIFSL